MNLIQKEKNFTWDPTTACGSPPPLEGRHVSECSFLKKGSPVGELAPKVTEGLLRESDTERKRFHLGTHHRLTAVPLP